jgi:hypothetical protein
MDRHNQRPLTECPNCRRQASKVEGTPLDAYCRCERCGWALIVDTGKTFEGKDASDKYLAWINEEPEWQEEET